MPVVASIAVDETTGQAYNVNADVVASQLAIELGAEKLVFINDVPGLIGPTGDLLSELSATQCTRAARTRRRGERRHDPQARERRARRCRPGSAGCTSSTAGSSIPWCSSCSRPRASARWSRPTPRPPGAVVNEPAVMATYARYPLTLVRGAGTRVWDDTGREFLDFAGALGVTALGHSHPAWVAAVREQLETLDMVSNLYATEPQAELARSAGGARCPCPTRACSSATRAPRPTRPRSSSRASTAWRPGSRRSWRSRGRSTDARPRRSPRPDSPRSARRSSPSWTGSGSCRPAISPPSTPR